jgi:hypothetical protein
MPPGAPEDLAAVDRAFIYDPGNLSVVVLKDIAEQEHRSLQRRKVF